MGNKFIENRSQMISYHLKSGGIYHPLVLKAFAQVPREQFIPQPLRSQAYTNQPLPIGKKQTISQPYVVALMTQLLISSRSQFEPSHIPVLEIGTGSGYQTAILCNIFQTVYTVERIKTLANRARIALKRLNITNFHLRVGDGAQGWPLWRSITHHQGFPAIIVTAAAPSIPLPLKQQLALYGHMVIPVGNAWNQQLLRLTRLKNNRFKKENHGPVAFVKLVRN